MILINRNTANTVILTLSEKTTLTPVYYLFEVINDTTNNVKCFIADDVSVNKLRYNEFLINESATEDLLNGTVSLVQSGYYKYNIYEQSSSTNLDPALATNKIDKGKLRVAATEQTIDVYSGNQTNYVVYNEQVNGD